MLCLPLELQPQCLWFSRAVQATCSHTPFFFLNTINFQVLFSTLRQSCPRSSLIFAMSSSIVLQCPTLLAARLMPPAPSLRAFGTSASWQTFSSMAAVTARSSDRNENTDDSWGLPAIFSQAFGAWLDSVWSLLKSIGTLGILSSVERTRLAGTEAICCRAWRTSVRDCSF